MTDPSNTNLKITSMRELGPHSDMRTQPDTNNITNLDT